MVVGSRHRLGKLCLSNAVIMLAGYRKWKFGEYLLTVCKFPSSYFWIKMYVRISIRFLIDKEITYENFAKLRLVVVISLFLYQCFFVRYIVRFLFIIISRTLNLFRTYEFHVNTWHIFFYLWCHNSQVFHYDFKIMLSSCKT